MSVAAMNATDVIFLSPVPLGRQVRVARVLKDWSQSELAVHATTEARRRRYRFKVQTADVGWLERDGALNARRKTCILAALGLQVAA